MIQDINALLDPGTGEASIESGIPSWATDLSRDVSSVAFLPGIYRCGGAEPSIPLSESSFLAEDHLLSIPLCFFDSVKTCSEQLEYYEEHLHYWEAWNELESSYLDINDVDADKLGPYGDYLARKEAFWRTLVANCKWHHNLTIPDSSWVQHVREWPREDNGTANEIYRVRALLIGSEADIRKENETITFEFRTSMNCAFSGRRLLATRLGYFCMGPGNSKPGDWIMVAPGLKIPIVVGEMPSERTIRMVGPAYVHGIMHGECIDHLRKYDKLDEDLQMYTMA